MKKRKILFLIVLTIAFIVSVFTIVKVNAQTYNETLVEDAIVDTYYTRRGGGKPYMSAQYHTYTMNGKVVYCIEPGVDITIHSYVGADGLVNSPYSDEINKKIELIGHYGYDYPGHHTLRYRMAAQSLIWETTGGQIVEFWTEASGYGDFINLNYERNQIMKLVNAHYNKPSFNGNSMEVIVGQEYKITDTNGLMSEYELYSADGLDVRISGNDIYFTPTTTGNLTLKVARKHYDNNTTIVYVGSNNNSQKMGYFRFSDPVVAQVNLNVLGGKIQIKKVDSENKSTTPQGEATLIGAKYNVIDSNGNVVDTLTIGSDYTATSKNLPLSNYTIKEISPSTGYYLNDKSYSVSVSSADTVYLTVEEEVIKGKIKVVKYDSETNNCKAQGNATLVGAKYEIRDKNNNLIDTVTIGDDCTGTTKLVPYGNYTISELSPSTGYYIDENTYTVNVKSSETVSVVSKENVIKGKIKITKYDSETNSCKALGQATLVGATFNIIDSNNKVVDTVTIGEDCTGTSKLVPYGYYKILEKSSPKGYTLTNEVFETYIYENKNYLITVKNDVIKNYISILKQYDYVDGNTTFLNAEANITFEIFYPDGTKYGEIKTDKNGYATLDIPYGVWKFSQKNSNTGFEKIYDFFITVDETSEKEQYYNILNNKIAAYLKVVKVDSETGKTIELANTKFKILNTDTNQYVSQYVGGKVYDTFETDETGTFTTYLKLEASNYKLVEISNPKNYLISKDGLEFTIGEDTEYHYTTYGAIIVVNFENTPIKGQVEIYKTGEKFVIENDSFKYDTISLEGIKFNLYADEDIKSADGNYLYYNKGDLVETLTSNSDGYVKSKKIPLGKYYLVEVSTKDNMVLDTTEHHFELTAKDNTTAIVYSTHELFNALKKGTLEFTKTDYSTSEGLPNVEFKIYTEKDKLIFSGKTDSDGKITLKELCVGKYYIVEGNNPNEGYVQNDEKVFFEIKENGEVVKAEMTNKKITSTLKITKLDEDKNKLSGVKFGIYDLEDNLLQEVETQEDGTLEITLEYGKFYFKELSVDDKYILTDEKIYFEVVENGAIIEHTIINYFKTGTLEFTKTDLVNGEVIPNTVIEIYTEKDELIFSGKTDSDGSIVIDNIRSGKFYIIEKKPADGFVLTDEKVFFEIKEDGEIVKAEMKNKPIMGTLEFTKVNNLNETLENAVIEIHNEDGELIFSGKTDVNGLLVVENIRSGRYSITELSAPDGHLINPEKIYFEITTDGEIVKATMVDEKIVVEVPNTGVNDYHVVEIVGSLITLFGIGVIVYAKKKRK